MLRVVCSSLRSCVGVIHRFRLFNVYIWVRSERKQGLQVIGVRILCCTTAATIWVAA